MKVSFNKRYFTPFLLVLVAEIAIAIFYFHRFVRGFLGDVLVVPLLYFFLRTFSNFSLKPSLLIVTGTAFLIEFFQFMKFSELLYMQSGAWKVILGYTFDWFDLLAYAIGGIAVYLIEKPKQ